jgi:3-oxoadipate enol-lactonase
VPTAELVDIDLHYVDRGSGRPLLLVPGIPAIANDWDALAEPLGETHRVIAFDNRGSGASTTTPAPYDCVQLAADAIGLLDALGIQRTDVFGMSLGGMIAQELALGWPERVDRLVLGCTHCGGEHFTRPDREAGRAFAMETDDWGERMRLLAPFAFSAGVDPAQLEAFIDKKAADVQPRDGYRGQIAAALAHDTYDRLPGIESRTLILTGEDDRVIPGDSSEVLHRRIAGSRLEVIPGSGHLFFLERPRETLRLLREFLG